MIQRPPSAAARRSSISSVADPRSCLVAFRRRARHALTRVTRACRLSIRSRLQPCSARVAKRNLTSDGLRNFQYDGQDRLSKVILGSTFVGTDSIAGNELAAHTYLHNAAGQRVFKSEPKTETTVPNSTTLGTEFVSWLQTNFSWLWATAQTNATVGDSYLYADGQLPSWALLGEYGNGGANSTGRTEYIWLPTSNGQAIPVGMLRSGKLIAIHTDHLGTPRLMVDNTNIPVWQWAYSAFGDNAPTGVVKPTTSAASAFISTPAGSNGNTTVTLLATSTPTQINNLRFPGQYADSETGQFYNYFRNYQPNQGRYTQNDPIGLAGGVESDGVRRWRRSQRFRSLRACRLSGDVPQYANRHWSWF